MSLNSSNFTSFLLSAYVDLGRLRYLVFFILLLLYIITLFLNALLISVICSNRSLHEPMYMFLSALFVNEIFGSSAVYPFLLLSLLKDGPVLISRPSCFLQIFCIHSYALAEYLLLCGMAYDRYCAICRPLHYNKHMTRSKVTAFVLILWVYVLFGNLMMIQLTQEVPLCGNVIAKVYCDNYPVLQLSCLSKSLNIQGLFSTALNTLLPLMGILWSYAQILKVCLSGSKQTRLKALTTCSPHLASVVNFATGTSFEIVQHRFNLTHLPHLFKVIMSLYFLMVPPISNPYIYGLVLTKLRFLCRRLLMQNTSK